MSRSVAWVGLGFALTTLVTACGSSGNGSKTGASASPVGPSAVAEASPTPGTSGPTAAAPRFGPIRPQSFTGSGPQDVAFPPRNEPFDFRANTLEVRYRDGLRRPSISSFVDIEGTIVWTQEYLRYRVNLCSHQQSIDKVFAQIDGMGIQQVCGIAPAGTPAFPPRQEPFQFRQVLEVKYRDGLRRQPVQTFVDPEGDVIWTQEYLRYRVSGCSHAEASAKVLAQIDGAGVPADCTPKPLFAQFVVNGPLGSDRCGSPATGFADCTFNASTSTGPNAITRYDWIYSTPLASATGTGVIFVPTIGCNFSASGAQNFPITVTLTVTDALGGRASFSNANVIGVRPPGVCGVPPTTASR
jgi:hypothetical protein